MKNIPPEHEVRDCDVCGAKDAAVMHRENWDIVALCPACKKDRFGV